MLFKVNSNILLKNYYYRFTELKEKALRVVMLTVLHFFHWQQNFETNNNYNDFPSNFPNFFTVISDIVLLKQFH